MSNVTSLYAESEELKDQGKLDDAIAKLNEVLAIDASHVLSHLALAVIHTRKQEHDKAIHHGEKACELEPTEAFNFTAMSVTYQKAWEGTQLQAYIGKAEEAMEKSRVLRGGH